MDELPRAEPVLVAPMRTFPVIRDLVTDVSFNYEMARRLPPFAPAHLVPTALTAWHRLLLRAMELESHPLDTADRRALVRHQPGLGLCNITRCCTEVCPEHIKITDNAIIPLKERVVDAA